MTWPFGLLLFLSLAVLIVLAYLLDRKDAKNPKDVDVDIELRTHRVTPLNRMKPTRSETNHET